MKKIEYSNLVEKHKFIKILDWLQIQNKQDSRQPITSFKIYIFSRLTRKLYCSNEIMAAILTGIFVLHFSVGNKCRIEGFSSITFEGHVSVQDGRDLMKHFGSQV